MWNILFSIIKPLLFKIDPEKAHDITLKVIEKINPLIPRTHYNNSPFSNPYITFPNRLGLAAGFDKNATATESLLKLGFGFVEIGTVTLRPQSGNPKPRLFRLTEDNAIINRMGFNNDGADIISSRIHKIRNANNNGIIGINIGVNKDSENRIADYALCADYFTDTASYFTINVSSPNTVGLRELQTTENLKRLLNDVLNTTQKKKSIPVFLKISPDRNDYILEDIVKLVNELPIAGLIASNTTITRPSYLMSCFKQETGGLSGKPLFNLSTELLKDIKKMLDKNKILIGVGGINSGNDAVAKIHAGCDVIQIYTGLVYQGQKLIDDIIKEFKKRDL